MVPLQDSLELIWLMIKLFLVYMLVGISLILIVIVSLPVVRKIHDKYTLKFNRFYLVVVQRDNAFFESEIKNYLKSLGIRNQISKYKGTKAKFYMDFFQAAQNVTKEEDRFSGEPEITFIGNKEKLSQNEAVLYGISIYGKEKPAVDLTELEKKLKEHST